MNYNIWFIIFLPYIVVQLTRSIIWVLETLLNE